MIKPAEKIADLSTGVFNQLAEKKTEQQAQLPMIDLSIGSPDLPPPQFVRDALADGVLKGDQYGYPLTGTEEFKGAVQNYYARRFGVSIRSEQVLQLMGSQDGLAHLALAYLDPGDIVLVPDPGYPIYSASVHIAGAKAYPLPLMAENNFIADLHSIPTSVLEQAKMMIVNYPGNPISSLAERSFFEELINFGLKHQILIVHDFAYCELIFDQQQPISILSIPGAEEIAIEFNSLSKSFNMAGCRIGYLLGKESYIKPLLTLKSHLDYGVFLPIQKAASLALMEGDHFLNEHRLTYEQRRNTFVQALHALGWEVRLPQGGMFVWGKLPDGWGSVEFSLKALEHGVVVTPGNAFGQQGEGYVRMALVQSEQALVEAAERLASVLQRR